MTITILVPITLWGLLVAATCLTAIAVIYVLGLIVSEWSGDAIHPVTAIAIVLAIAIPVGLVVNDRPFKPDFEKAREAERLTRKMHEQSLRAQERVEQEVRDFARRQKEAEDRWRRY